MNRSKRGFTLVEVIVTLVIVVIVAAIATPNIVGFVNSHKRQNCVTRMESLLSGIESSCASKRFLTTDAVSASIISAAASFDDSVKDAVSSNYGLTLYDFCNDENDVCLSWEIDRDDTACLYNVVVKAECSDGNDGECSFSCGMKEEVEYSDKSSLAQRLISIVESDDVKNAYQAADSSALATAISSAANISESEFDAAVAFVDSLSITNSYVKMNTTLSLLLTIVVNENESYLTAFDISFMGKDYMPIVLYSGDQKSDIYSSSIEFSTSCFMLYGYRDMTLSDYMEDENIYLDADTVAFNVNAVWSQDLKSTYFLTVYEADGSPTFVQSDVALSTYSSSDWTEK